MIQWLSQKVFLKNSASELDFTAVLGLNNSHFLVAIFRHILKPLCPHFEVRMWTETFSNVHFIQNNISLWKSTKKNKLNLTVLKRKQRRV